MPAEMTVLIMTKVSLFVTAQFFKASAEFPHRKSQFLIGVELRPVCFYWRHRKKKKKAVFLFSFFFTFSSHYATPFGVATHSSVNTDVKHVYSNMTTCLSDYNLRGGNDSWKSAHFNLVMRPLSPQILQTSPWLLFFFFFSPPLWWLVPPFASPRKQKEKKRRLLVFYRLHKRLLTSRVEEKV